MENRRLDSKIGSWHNPVCDWAGMTSQEDGDEDMDLALNDFDDSSQSGTGRAEGLGIRGSGARSSQSSKRSLEEASSDEGSAGGRKRVREQNSHKVILKFKNESEIAKVGVLALSREIKKKLGDVVLARVLRDSSLLIVCKSEEQKNTAMQISSIGKVAVSERKVVGERKGARGVITGIPLDEDLDKLKNSLGAGVISVKRMMRWGDGQRVQSMSVLLEFQGGVLPERVKVGCLSFPVREFVPPPLRCYKCQLYGHIAAVCRGKQKCYKCGGEHRIEECKENSQVKCCNCGGQHTVTYGGCEVRKKAVEIEKVKKENNITYAEAVRKVQVQRGGGAADFSVNPRSGGGAADSNVSPRSEGRIVMDVEDLLVFMSYVINCAEQAKHKADKIKIVVKGAEKFLGAKGASWEKVYKRLEEERKAGGTSDRT